MNTKKKCIARTLSWPPVIKIFELAKTHEWITKNKCFGIFDLPVKLSEFSNILITKIGPLKFCMSANSL